MKQDNYDRGKERDAIEDKQRQVQARDDLQAAKNQDFYARLGLEAPDTHPPEDAFIVSIHAEHWTHEDLEAGETYTRDIELDRATLDADDLVRHARDYGLAEPSCSDPRMNPEIWFRSTFPSEDRAYFEQGVEKYYSLHVHEVNGHPPAPEDYQRVADLIGVRFDRALDLPQREEQEGPDLCL
ncbi:hypothetical protein [Paracandidimonas lactea]|uniref:hypothetical protein n=1 Tax=Paracandidimonas lactea TaxID=2895524 RepID=UPI001F18C161|nr:hypothetical protein [Paracandidimonas lactea]